VVRYGNVAGSRGSVIPFFQSLIEKGVNKLPVTSFKMTRFWITLDQGVDLVFKALDEDTAGAVYVSKIPSFKIIDLAQAMMPNTEHQEIGIREGEKLHEVMITSEDARNTFDYNDHYIIYPNLTWWDPSQFYKAGGKKIRSGFNYCSDKNKDWLLTEDLKQVLKEIEIVF
jgi:FlaA1/EpsC-like NDP-sugar epimerase